MSYITHIVASIAQIPKPEEFFVLIGHDRLEHVREIQTRGCLKSKMAFVAVSAKHSAISAL